MANMAQAKKRVRQNEKKRAQNAEYKSTVRTAVKKFNEAADKGADNQEELFRKATKLVDQAESKNLIHKNKANREKSKMAAKLKK